MRPAFDVVERLRDEAHTADPARDSELGPELINGDDALLYGRREGRQSRREVVDQLAMSSTARAGLT